MHAPLFVCSMGGTGAIYAVMHIAYASANTTIGRYSRLKHMPLRSKHFFYWCSPSVVKFYLDLQIPMLLEPLFYTIRPFMINSIS